MPTVAVYVPADLYRRLGSSDDRVRVVARGALEREAGLGAGDPEAVFSPAGADIGSVASAAAPTVKRASPAPSSCVKFRTHHIYHSGKPCPECGYPNVEGAVT